MKQRNRRMKTICLLLVLILTSLSLSACSSSREETAPPEAAASAGPDTSRYLVAIEEEPDTVDFQCTSIYYTIAQNVFNRLVEMEKDDSGNVAILPSLAESWDISADHRSYTFHLRKGVTFSNGSP
ncbi:MAG: hypothetical protein IKH30_19665 [Clostridia bacterium]|nr:hypothetical protein [Clostridia bacterium]